MLIVRIRTGKENALCKSTLNDRIDGTVLTFRAFLTSPQLETNLRITFPQLYSRGTVYRHFSDRRVGGPRGLSECGNEENWPLLPLLGFKPRL